MSRHVQTFVLSKLPKSNNNEINFQSFQCGGPDVCKIFKNKIDVYQTMKVMMGNGIDGSPTLNINWVVCSLCCSLFLLQGLQQCGNVMDISSQFDIVIFCILFCLSYLLLYRHFRAFPIPLPMMKWFSSHFTAHLEQNCMWLSLRQMLIPCDVMELAAHTTTVYCLVVGKYQLCGMMYEPNMSLLTNIREKKIHILKSTAMCHLLWWQLHINICPSKLHQLSVISNRVG